ncbi:MAG TPA: carotenoid oxygenase family protein [Acidimicrobiia bacterium]|nr:carotenoid oxygenase family protein [Acidimicrobiia bacterium]
MTKFYLEGNFAPVRDEAIAYDLPIEGAIPPGLAGRYLRNGPNPAAGDPGHWFFGEGMLHGVELRDGRATWYRNRYVRTASFEAGRRLVGENGMLDLEVDLANTHVVAHGGKILALVENRPPTEVTAELDTVGTFDFGGRLTTAMTAHPKRCPVTGELHFFGYGVFPPLLTYHRADSAGNLVQSERITVPGPTMIHDFAITEHSVVFMDLPVVCDPSLLMARTMPYRWSDDYGARIGVMPRGGSNADVRWFDVEPCYVFHVLNAAERQPGHLEIDVARYPHLWRDSQDAFEPTTLHRWTVDVAAGTVKEETLDDRSVEFPRVDERKVGRPARFGYAVQTRSGPDGIALQPRLVKYDLVSGHTEEHDLGAGRMPGEGVFVPASDSADEDDGYVMAYVYDAARDGSNLVILDASDFAASPVATVALPQRVPFGFHGSWVGDAEL